MTLTPYKNILSKWVNSMAHVKRFWHIYLYLIGMSSLVGLGVIAWEQAGYKPGGDGVANGLMTLGMLLVSVATAMVESTKAKEARQ